jgi:phosphoribosyl-ATP pyrophosphohydrolase
MLLNPRPASPSSGQWICSGTKRISIALSSVTNVDGLVSLYTFHQTIKEASSGGSRRSISPTTTSRLSGESGLGVDNSGLHVMITDGKKTYYINIRGKDIRHMPSEIDEKEQLNKVASVLLRPDDETFKVSYKRIHAQVLGGSQDSNDTTSIEVSIRKTLLNNIVRPVWEGIMNDIGIQCYQDLPLFARCAYPESDDTTTTDSSSSGLALPIMLGDTINRLHKEIETLRHENRVLENNTLRWKSTSEKMSNKWENEKSDLTHHFLTLFNDHKARHVEVVKELDQLKGKKQRVVIGSSSSSSERSIIDRTTVKRRSREMNTSSTNNPDLHDDNDYVIYDNAVVNRLAAGSSTSKQQSSLHDMTQQINTNNRAKEYSHPKELFSSDDDDDMIV